MLRAYRPKPLSDGERHGGPDIVIQYYRRGLRLAARAMAVYAIDLALTALLLIPQAVGTQPLKLVLGLLSLVASLFYFGYNLSTALFLQDVQQDHELSASHIWSVTRNNTARFVLPFILFIIAATLAIVPIAIITVAVARPGRGQHAHVTSISHLSYIGRLAFSPPIAIIASIFVFVPIFFAIERRGLFRSMWKSTQYAVNHFDFFGTVLLIQVVLVCFSSLAPTDLGWVSLMRSVPYEFVQIVILAAALLHYQAISPPSDEEQSTDSPSLPPSSPRTGPPSPLGSWPPTSS